MTRREYIAVDLKEARRLVERGELVALLMLPETFGGDERPENVVFVPPWIAARKAEIERDVIVPLLEEGRRVEYSVAPEYEGASLVPIALDIQALAPDPHFYRLAIWGKALRPKGV